VHSGKLLIRTLAVAACGCVAICQFGRVSVTADLLNVLLIPLVFVLAIIAVFAFGWRDRLAACLAFAGLTVASLQLFDAVLEVAPRHSASEQSSGPVLRIASVNAFHEDGNPAELVATVTRARPDILMVQEANGASGTAITMLMHGYYRVSSCGAPPCSLSVFSRWPAVRIADHRPQGTKLPDLLIARIRAPFGDFNVITAHLPRMYLPHAESFRAMLADAAANNDGVPLLLGGDFNTPTGSFALFRFEDRTRLRRAERWIPTYPANLLLPAFAAIDHIYVSAGWRVLDCERLTGSGSDHFGLTCEVVPDHWANERQARP
jgi:endonuclease/exonuclease/phosphatase (EEP) superfamily protein YafD